MQIHEYFSLDNKTDILNIFGFATDVWPHLAEKHYHAIYSTTH